MKETRDLFADFAPVSKEQWTAQATKDLKGAGFAELLHQTDDGLTVEPFYTKEDTDEPQPVFTHTDWEICQTIEVYEAEIANIYALEYLNNGITAIIFKLFHPVSFEALLKDIGIGFIAVQFHIYKDASKIAQDFDIYITTKGLDKTKLNLTLNYDPIADLVAYGKWTDSEEKSARQLTSLIDKNPHYRNLSINGEIYHNAGAPPGYELGCMLAHANEYLTWSDSASQINIQVNLATGADYFIEIAKLRAVRKAFALLLNTYCVNEEIYIHATSAERNLTIYDQHNNLLRTTTEAMAAVAGGCNSLEVLPFDATYRQADDFSERMARNIQLILKGESYFDKVSDVAAGSYFIETLTEELAQKGWAYFKEIESNGGLIASLRAGSIQQEIEKFAAKGQALFDEGKNVLVGINKYPLATQKMSDEAVIDVEQPYNHTAIQPLIPKRIAASAEAERLASETQAPTA